MQKKKRQSDAANQLEKKRLWDKGQALHAEAHRFTVGDDPILDLALVRWDALGTIAHARMLARLGILDQKECALLVELLDRVVERSDRGAFEIPYELEDCHTAIEQFLTENAQIAGGKIHTGRSRNDQVQSAMRLMMRARLVALMQLLVRCATAVAARYHEHKDVPMPGYTHMQPAMPSSVGMWWHAFLEGFLDLFRSGFATLELLDSSPLGVGSGFGVSLPLDREFVAEQLGFAAVQRSPIDVQNSRGRNELRVIRWCVDVGTIVEKLAIDLLQFSMREFGFFSLPAELTTGSSIMPQKRNPDILELLRGRVSRLRGAEDELRMLIAKMPSNYHRDYQYTKAPVIRALSELEMMLPMVELVARSVTVNPKRLLEAMSSELYVTYDAFRQVREGVPFRDAYRASAERMQRGEIDYGDLKGDFELIAQGIDRDMKLAVAELGLHSDRLGVVAARLQKIESELRSV